MEMQQNTDIESPEQPTKAQTPAESLLSELVARVTKLENALEVVKTNMPSIQFPA